METRFSKKAHVAEMEANETSQDLPEEVKKNVAEQPQDKEDVPPQSKKRLKIIKGSPRKQWAPTGTLEFAKLKEQAKKDQQMIKNLEERIVYLEETNRELKKDKDFLMSQLKAPSQSPASSQMPGSRKTAEVLSSSPSSGSPSPSSNSSSFSSSELEEMEKKKKKKKKKSKGHIDAHSRSRITSPDGVIRRYKKAMKKFSKCGSMKRAFSAISVDRNTIARTAIIAELAITFPDVYKGLLGDADHTKISEFAECCRRAITKEMAETITAKKKGGKLLPIVYKYT